jgi:hypothetical protein
LIISFWGYLAWKEANQKMRWRSWRKWTRSGTASLILIVVSWSSTYAIVGTPGGYDGDSFADVLFEYNVHPPPEAGRQDLNWVLGGPGFPTFRPPARFPYIHLGNGGYVTVQFTDNRIYNGPGDDFKVVEEALDRPPNESAIVSVSQDGRTFYEIGNVVPGDYTSTDFDLGKVGLDWALYVRVVDNTSTFDGFELDAVVARNSQEATTVSVDVKPGSCPNSLNPKSRGVLPVAILGSEDFDVTRIRGRSIRLEGVAPIRSSVEDVGTPSENSRDVCRCSDHDHGDGYPDLSLKFDTQKVVKALGDLVKGETRVLRLTGKLSDETWIQGMDCVVILGDLDDGIEVEDGSLTKLNLIDPLTIADPVNRPFELIGDFFDMEIEVGTPGDTATVRITLSSPAPAGCKWYKYSYTDGWVDYSAHAQFNANRDQVTVTLVDGGTGDDDDLANGVIQDPSGLGADGPITPTSPRDGAGGGSGGGCFLSSASGGFTLKADHGQVATKVAPVSILLILPAYHRRSSETLKPARFKVSHQNPTCK